MKKYCGEVGDRVRFWHLGPRPTTLDGALGTIIALTPSFSGLEATIRPDDPQYGTALHLIAGAVEGYEIERAVTTCPRHGLPAPALLHGEPCCVMCVNTARATFRTLRHGGPVVLRRLAATEASRMAFLWQQALVRAKRATGPRDVATLRQAAHYWRQQTRAYVAWERQAVRDAR